MIQPFILLRIQPITQQKFTSTQFLLILNLHNCKNMTISINKITLKNSFQNDTACLGMQWRHLINQTHHSKCDTLTSSQILKSKFKRISAAKFHIKKRKCQANITAAAAKMSRLILTLIQIEHLIKFIQHA